MKKGIVNIAADLFVTFFGVVVLIIVVFGLSSCVKAERHAKIKPVIDHINDKEELLMLLRTPIEFDGSEVTFSQLFTRYYYNTQDRGKLKEFLQDELQDFVKKTDKGDECWNVMLKVDGKETLLDLWDHCGDQKFKKFDRATESAKLPLYPLSRNSYIEIFYGTQLKISDSTWVAGPKLLEDK